MEFFGWLIAVIYGLVALAIPRRAPPPARPAAAKTKSIFDFDWESIVGVKLFAGIAAVAIVLAMILLFKIATDRGIFKPPIRAAVGLISGAALIFICELRIARGYKA